MTSPPHAGSGARYDYPLVGTGAVGEEALALLRRGTALRRAGRRDEALTSLDHADEVASRVEVASRAI